MRSLLLIAIMAVVAGCAQRAAPPPAAAAPSLPSAPVSVHPAAALSAPSPATLPVAAALPLLLHIPGVSGESVVDHDLIRGLVKGNVGAEMRIYDWTCNDPGVPALHAYARNQEQSQKIADQITQTFRADPTRKIYLTSHSGGGGVATWALEKLPADVQIETLLLLAPALSPSYDLSKALAHVRGKAYVFHSKFDTVVLSVGTRVFGTMDGVIGDAAGFSGFVRPKQASAREYAKLVQQPYDAAWMQYGNEGDHIGCTATPFARAVLAPLVGGPPATTQPAENVRTPPLRF